MKKLFVFVFSLLFMASAYSQSIIEREFSQYVDREDATHVFVTSKFFDFASIIGSDSDNKDMKEMSDFASKITSFSLIKVPNLKDPMADFKKGLNSTRSDNFEELLRVREKDTRFTIFVDEEADVVYEVVGLGVVDGEFIAMSLIGEMDLNKVAEFIEKADNESFSPLSTFKNKNASETKVYPNPSNAGSNIRVDIPENLIGGEAIIYDASGNKVKTMAVSKSSTSIRTNNLTSGNYFIEIQKDGISVKKQFIIIE